MDDGDDPYEILGVSRDATEAEIRKAHKKLIFKYHPDKARTEEQKEEFHKISYRLNDARDTLLDEELLRAWFEKQEEGDDYNDNHDQGYNSYNAYEQERAERPGGAPKRADASNLGTPYEGSMGSTPFMFCRDGSNGHAAQDGLDGRSGEGYGHGGMNGTNAGPAGNGQPGADMKIFFDVRIDDDGYFVVKVESRSGDEVLDPRREYLGFVPLKVFEKVDWSSRGGLGGRGGKGGHGGHGYRGYPGKDATRYRSGTNGGPGGDGGDGGLGTHGGDGGRGGHVELCLERDDIYLLMVTAGCQNDVGDRVQGGMGGEKGRHGHGGSGGPGGVGGSSYTYTTQRAVQNWDSHRNCYVTDYVTDTHVVPGGSRGPSGYKGSTPKSPLYDGQRGNDGTFQIRVNDNGKSRLYNSRYDLLFVNSETLQVSDMQGEKTYEFGETVIVSKCLVMNSGGMEMPRQRVMLGIEASKEVHVFNKLERLYLARDTNLEPGREMHAQEGNLSFECPLPEGRAASTDYDPIRTEGWVKYNAYQLGPENKTEDVMKISDFKAKYSRFHAVETGEKLSLGFPVENRDGLRGLHALAGGETTLLSFNLRSMTNQSMGERAKTKRALFVQFYYADDQEYDISLDQVEVRGPDGKVVNVTPTLSPKGYRQVIPFLGGGGDTKLHLSFNLKDDDIPTASRGALQADVYLQRIPELHSSGSSTVRTKKVLVQRRIFEVSVQPRFKVSDDAGLVLVCTTASMKEQVAAWEAMGNRLGLKPQVYALSRYGHLDGAGEAEKWELKEAFKNKVVVILNEEYRSNPNTEATRTETHRPTFFLNSHYEFDPSTRFLVVGGDRGSVTHLTSTAAAHVDGDEDSSISNRKKFREMLSSRLESERADGFPSARSNRSSTKVTIKARMFFEPKKETMEKMMNRRAAQLTKWLNKQDRLRPYVVEWSLFDDAPRLVEDEDGEKKTQKCFTKLYELGELRIRAGMPRFENPMVMVESERGGGGAGGARSPFANVHSIQNQSMLYATLSALPFDRLITVFLASVRAMSGEEDDSNINSGKQNDTNDKSKEEGTTSSSEREETEGNARKPSREGDASFHKQVCSAAADVLISDFLLDVSNYYDGRMAVDKIGDRSPVIRDLLHSDELCNTLDEALQDKALKAALTPHLSYIFAGFRCAATSKDLKPWWNPCSRKHKARKDLEETLDVLQRSWSHVLNEEAVEEEYNKTVESVQYYIKKVRKKFWVRRQGRWRAGLNHVMSPRNEERYPRAPGFDQTTRVRRAFEFDSGDTHKIKKAEKAQNFTPQRTSELLTQRQNHQSIRMTVRQAVANDIDEFGQ